MFIKYVFIKKFKSYRELVLGEPLSPSVNVIIGPNGHGKSNFLDAIIFVLTDKYTNIRHEDKKLLVHEDPGEETQLISVELIIDNKQRRFPVDKDTVSITKTYYVNENREEITINQKKLMKSDVYNLLESAGFCKQNPYYIIQQGKINTIINMNEFELFEQFAEVTGTKVYEEKKLESMKLLEESKDNRAKIVKQSEEISDYIKRLDIQCEDLSEFEKLETKKKACDCFIYNEKVAELQINCDLLEERKRDQLSELQSISTAMSKIREKINERLTVQYKNTKTIESLKTKITRCDDEINAINHSQFREEVSLKMLTEKNKTSNEEKQQMESELKLLTQEKTKLNAEYSKVEQKLSDLTAEISSYQRKYNELSGKSDLILLRKGTKSNDPQRVNYMTEELQKLKSKKDEAVSKICDMDTSIGNDNNLNTRLNSELQTIEMEIKENSMKLKTINEGIVDFKRKRIDCVNNLKKVDIEIKELNDETENIKGNIKQIERQVPNFETLDACMKIKKENIPGVYGMLLDLIEVDKKFRNAVDIISKDKLYSLIVDTMDTANKVLEINKKSNGPVISILPIEWNKDIKQVNYPSGNEAVPLVNYIKPNTTASLSHEEIQCIIQKVYGKSLLVKNYEVGVKLAKQFNLNCVTPENEVIYSGAYVTKVGYYDYKKQRCSLYEQLSDYHTRIEEISLRKLELDKLRMDNTNLETKLLRDSQQLMSNKNEISFKLQELSNLQQTKAEEVLTLAELIKNKKSMIDKLLGDKTTLEQKISLYNNILNGKNSDMPSQVEDEELSVVTKEKEIIERKLIELEKAKNYITQQKIKIETKINDQLNIKEIELKNRLNNLLNLNNSKFDFTQEKEMISEIELNLKEIENYEKAKLKFREEINKVEADNEQISLEVNAMRNEMNKVNEKINKAETELKAIILSLNDSNDKKTQLIKQIASLGQVNAEELEKLAKLKEKQLKLITNESGIDIRDHEKKLHKVLAPIYKKLEEVNLKIKKFEKINRFALNDYKLFKQKRDEINEKLEDLHEKEREILEVIKVLDEKKETAIASTFNKVQKHFEFFFRELVPTGFASLVLDNTVTQGGITNKAIYINVSFSGYENSSQSMHQLSGGQKTAVAVALIFALSKIDPPPFYILDEIDAALDPAMRGNLAKLISNLSEHNQYIISSFKSEILEVSESAYQVKFINKSSNFFKISKEEAKKFIKETFI